jgi:hypothetical protein
MPNIYEYMATGLKLSKAEDRNNLVAFLVLTLAGVGIVCCFQHQRNKKCKRENDRIRLDNDMLKIQNMKQGEDNKLLQNEKIAQQRRILELERDKQTMAKQLMEKEKQIPQA